jgi:hypothetical protein
VVSEDIMTAVIHRGNVVERTLGDISPRQPAIRTDAVSVVYTTVEDTLEAARVAADLAKGMGVPLRVVHFRTVPRQVPVDRPDGLSPIETQAFLARLRADGITARIRVYLCRDEMSTIGFAFRSNSIVVIGGRRSWWPTRAERWRHALEGAGHFVVFVDPFEHSEHKEPSHA